MTEQTKPATPTRAHAGPTPLDLAALSFPALTPVRARLTAALVRLVPTSIPRTYGIQALPHLQRKLRADGTGALIPTGVPRISDALLTCSYQR